MKYILISSFYCGFLLFGIDLIAQVDSQEDIIETTIEKVDSKSNKLQCLEHEPKVNAIQKDDYLFAEGYNSIYDKIDKLVVSSGVTDEVKNGWIGVVVSMDSLGHLTSLKYGNPEFVEHLGLEKGLNKIIDTQLNLMYLIDGRGQIIGYDDSVYLGIYFCPDSKSYISIVYDDAYAESDLTRGHKTCPDR